MRLDANTPMGQVALKDGDRGVDAFLDANPHLGIAYTDQARPADVDGMIYGKSDGTLKAVLEIKTRYFTLERLMGDYEGKALIDRFKLDKCAKLAESMGCDCVTRMVLPRSKCALARSISNHKGELEGGISVGKKKCRRTINSEAAVEKDVAYVDMTNAKKYSL